MLKIETARAVPMNVRIVRQGDRHGLNDCLTHNEARPLVEFYDASSSATPRGQFITSYYLSTLLGHVGGLERCVFIA